ncbi:lytic murein transglycosylase [Jannaschia seohaensis]|uniref:Membrane-bound lytic murein transglycosylase B n=1 Tax=Jannaschia seohaensis TaxID=475081 RepID=A0A2Y9A1J6_9RHOB|nr:lytic murein transglycosylase [Jannaschia seohaensis]PWJ21986.1 membrane-bound lytic murein transglycosylase B [Jannaschia seohaensis]SSA38264.1 membrane-bound lytic murein transglycosylase B [Jannaschia seohaensis]
MIRALLLTLVLSTTACAQPVTSPRPAMRGAASPSLDAWLAGFRETAQAAGISDATWTRATRGLAYRADIVRRDRTQSEFTKTVWDYLDTAVSDARIRNGRAALAYHRADLDRIEATHGVPAEILVAIWGLESSYGAFKGDTPTLEAIATLAFDARRAALWEREFLAALQIVERGEAVPATLRGSWAGAMGHTQFLPSSFLAHAQDWDGDGRRDIWGTPVDALASTATYLKANGWQTGRPWGTEVVVPEGFDYLLTGERTTKTGAEWAALGVRARSGALPEGPGISIRVPGGHQGTAFATTPNFRALESYNTADAYVIGVGHLADRIAGGLPLIDSWPRGDRALTFDERVEMQRRLAAAGFDPQKFDGLVGPLTLEAIRRWQAARGLVPDGYMSPQLLARLRREG